MQIPATQTSLSQPSLSTHAGHQSGWPPLIYFLRHAIHIHDILLFVCHPEDTPPIFRITMNRKYADEQEWITELWIRFFFQPFNIDRKQQMFAHTVFSKCSFVDS